MVDGQDVNLVLASEAIHDPVRSVSDLPDVWAFALRNHAARFRKGSETIGRRNDARDHHGREVKRVLADQGGEFRQGPNEPGESKGQLSREELLLDLSLGNELACFGLPQSLFNLYKEAKTLDGIFERCVLGKAA